MKRLRVHALLGAALLTGFLVTRTVQAATPPTIPPAPRAEFNLLTPIRISDVCFTPDQDDPPGTTDMVHLGIDGTGPYFGIWYKPLGFANPVLLSYRPRGLMANTVAQFGDGGIHAVELFRKYYERWRRAQTNVGAANGVFVPTGTFGGVTYPGLQYDHWWPACIFCGPNGGLFTCPIIQMVITAEEWALGQWIQVMCEPVTFCFEDYDIPYKPI
jgi:hypothetical protein